MFATMTRRMAPAAAAAAGGGITLAASGCWMTTERQVTNTALRKTQQWASSRLIQTLQKQQKQQQYSRTFSSSDTTTAASGGGGFVKWYEGHLNTNPVLTKMCTGTVLWSTGDAVAQVVPHLAAGTDMPKYDYARTGRAALFGFAIHAPLSHLHFNFLEWMTVKAGLTGLSIPVFKTVMCVQYGIRVLLASAIV